MKLNQIIYLLELKINEEVKVVGGGWGYGNWWRRRKQYKRFKAKSQHPNKNRSKIGGGCCKLYNLTDLRPRLTKTDKVVHQIGGKPHIYWILLIPRLVYCQSQSVKPTTWDFCLSTLPSAFHLLVF